MGRTTYSAAILLLRHTTNANFFGWVNDDLSVDAVVYFSYAEAEKLLILKRVFSEKIWNQLNITFAAESYIRVCLPDINSHSMIAALNELKKPLSILLKKIGDKYCEQRSLKVATVSMPTGNFAKLSYRTIAQQIELFHQHVSTAYRLLTERRPLFPDEMALCVMPEFYSHCSSTGSGRLFMSHNTQTLLLAGYCKTSRYFPELLIMVNITATTATEERDAVAVTMGHKARRQKINTLVGLKNGEVVYVSYKLNKGPADIPESELLNAEAERNTYHQSVVNRKLMTLDYLKMFKGITFAGSVCIDAQEGVLGKYLQKQFPDFHCDEYGPAIQIISSCSMALPINYKKRSELDGAQVVTPMINQGLIVQADGHDKIKRSGIWLVDGENFVRQKPKATATLGHQVEIESYEVCATLLHNRLHEKVGGDIDEVKKAQAFNTFR